MDTSRSYTFCIAFICWFCALVLLNAGTVMAQNPPHSISFEHQDHRYTEKNLRLSGDTIRHTAVKPVYAANGTRNTLAKKHFQSQKTGLCANFFVST